MKTPQRIKKISEYLISQYEESVENLPPPTILSGERGTGKSWILREVHHFLKTNSLENKIIPIELPLQLSPLGVVENIVRLCEESRLRVLVKSSEFPTSVFRYILFIENIDTLLNLNVGETGFTLPRRAKGKGAAQYDNLRHVGELRGYLIENSDKVSILASSSPNMGFISDSDQPFFQYFNLIDVKPLSSVECREYVLNGIGKNSNARSIGEVLDRYNKNWILILTDGKLSYINLLNNTLVDIGNELKTGTRLEEVIKELLQNYFYKIEPYVRSELADLSYSEKSIMDKIITIPDYFSLKSLSNYPTTDQNIWRLVNGLKSKGILESDPRSGFFSIKSPSVKAYLRFYRRSEVLKVLQPMLALSNR